MSASGMDPFGRPIVQSEGDAALAADVAQAQLTSRSGWQASYGGRRQVGVVVRGGLLHNNFVKFGFPGAVLGFLLALFLFPPVEKGKVAGQEGEEGGETKQKAGKTIKWAGPAPPPGTEVKLMLVVRDDLGMSVGKIAAQCSHAAVGIVQKIGSRKGLMQAWEACGQPKIAVKCKDIDELIALAQAAEKLQLPTYVIQDAGRTEVEPGTTTVLAIGPGAADVINQVTGQLKLLR